MRSRFGYHCHTTHGIGIVEVVPFAFTRHGIHRKAARLARSLRRQDLRYLAAEEIDR